MTAFNKIMSDVQRRAKARCVRAMVEMDPPKSIEQASANHNISRASAYRFMQELAAWESTATFQDEATEILAQTKHTTYDPHMLLLASPKFVMAFAQGHDGVDAGLFGGMPDPRDSLDPLCD